MAIGDFLKGRRERESALPPGAIRELSADADSVPASDPAEAASASDPPEADPAAATDPIEGDAGSERGGATELPGADAAELGAMLRRAAKSGLPQVSTESHTVDPQSGGLGNEILAILAGHGIDPGGGLHEIDPAELRNLYEQVREALRRQGVDPDSGVGT